jgi:hypothetical protein
MARYPRLRFEPMEEQFWEGVYVTGAVKVASQP